MGLFSFGSKTERFGVILDVGSGSVLTAIIHSDTAKKEPVVVWAHREHAALKQIDSIEQSAKSVAAALIQAGMKLDSEGRNALREYNPKAKLTSTQCGISAPWSYTVTKSINVSQDSQIQVSSRLIDDLLLTAQKQAEEELSRHASILPSGLTTIARSTMDMLTNGYRVASPEGELARSLNLTQATVVAQDYIMDGVSEIGSKLFPSAKIEALSFILLMYCSVRTARPNMDDFCIVDVTDEATEIGIVRDGSLTYATHTPYGLFSLAREISYIANIPLSESLGHLRYQSVAAIKTLFNDKIAAEIEIVFDAYRQQVADILNETGDTLSIPKQVILNVEQSHESLCLQLLRQATKSATKIEHSCFTIRDELMEKHDLAKTTSLIGSAALDTALLLHAEFFHKEQHCLDFKYL